MPTSHCARQTAVPINGLLRRSPSSRPSTSRRSAAPARRSWRAQSAGGAHSHRGPPRCVFATSRTAVQQSAAAMPGVGQRSRPPRPRAGHGRRLPLRCCLGGRMQNPTQHAPLHTAPRRLSTCHPCPPKRMRTPAHPPPQADLGVGAPQRQPRAPAARARPGRGGARQRQARRGPGARAAVPFGRCGDC